jgi:metal-responsive CopG/Arc/MetJ family transcriptional regulator
MYDPAMVNYQRGEDLVRISMNLPRDMWKRLKIRAAEDESTATEIVVKLLEQYLSETKHQKKKAR